MIKLGKIRFNFLFPLTAAFLASGCVANQQMSAPFNVSSGTWFDGRAVEAKGTFVAPHDPELLAEGDQIKTAIFNAVDLVRKKRFDEARQLFAEARELQPKKSEAFQSLTSSMALTALRGGNVSAFKRLAGQLDQALGEPVRVPVEYVEVISLYRLLEGKAPPVNIPENMQRLRIKPLTITTNTN